VINFLSRGRLGKPRPVANVPMDPQLKLLSQWQSERLARTYSDLLASSLYGTACGFFLSDLYGPYDFSQRDQDIRQVQHSMRRVLPARILHSLNLVVELQDNTLSLDQTLLQVLVDELGMTDAITTEMYAEGYRRCGNYEERTRQIDLIVEVGRELDQLVHMPITSVTLRMTGRPARLAGWSKLHNFLVQGYAAFKTMGDASTFLRIIENRERRILDKIFSKDPAPFTL
jgi:hypothetical protein